MIVAKIDSKMVNETLDNAVKYSYGFLDGINMDQIEFNRRLGDYVVEALGLYIDTRARMSPEQLHHVYEWNQTGSQSGRLFDFSVIAKKRVITFKGKFLKSSSISDTSTVPFRDKARIMENGIGINIEPRNGVLVFEDEGETVFTATGVYIAHPGGDEVAGSFAMVVEEFFGEYFTNALLRPFFDKLGYPIEFAQGWGNKSGRSQGISAGRKYLRSAGASIQ
jgi:hypothetical protein